MQYTITVRQKLALEWGLSLQQAAVFNFLTTLSTWASAVTTSDGVFYHVRRTKMAEEMPLVSRSPSTYKRHLQALEKAGVIDQILVGSMPCVRLTEKGALWLQSGNSGTCAKMDAPAQNCAGTCAELRSQPAQICAPINNTSDHYTSDNKETPHNPPAPYDEIQALYNDICLGMRQCRILNDKRKRRIRKLWQTIMPSLDHFRAYFTDCAAIAAYTGQLPPRPPYTEPYRADLDFLLRDDTIARVLEND